MKEARNPLSPLRLRRLLNQTLGTDSELDSFCFDYLPEVARRFTDGMDRATKVNLLLMLVPPVALLNRLRVAYPSDADSLQQATQGSGETPEPPAPTAESQQREAEGGRSAERVPVLWCSHASEDEPLFRELFEHLTVFKQQGVLNIVVTAAPLVRPSQTAAHPDIILLLLSRKYLVSGMGHIQKALELYQGPRHPALLTVLLAPALWESTPLATVAPPLLDGQPLTNFPNHDEAWVAVANAVRQAILFPPASQRDLRQAATPVSESTRSLADVFVYAGPSKIIFVETAQSRELVQRLRLPTVPDGLVVEGPSGIGKTTAVLRAIDELQAQRRYKYVSASDKNDLIELDHQASENVPQAGYLVIDDFHLLDGTRKEQVARLVKRLCDRNRRDTKVVIVGINPIGTSLVVALPDIRGRYSVVRMQGRQPDEKIDELIALGERAANVEFHRRSRFVDEADGSFALAQRLCYEATLLDGITERPLERALIGVPAQEVAKLVYQTLEQYYRPRLLAFAAWDEKSPPRGACLYLLWHLSHDEQGSVMVPEVRLQYREQRNLDEAFAWLLDGNLYRIFEELPRLRQVFHYRRLTGALSAEDPQLWFYLRHVDWVKFAQASGHAVDPLPDALGRPVLRPPSTSPTVVTPSVIASARPLVLLHLSDLHFSEKAQASRWYSQLAEDLRREQKISRIDVVALTGDIVNRGQEEGYGAAEQFLLMLAREFELKPHQIVLVPGNHDVNWNLAREAYVPHLRSQYHGAFRPGIDFEESPQSRYIEIRDDEKHKQRLRPFADFYQRVRRQAYALNPEDQVAIYHFEEAGLLLLGLNSAWQIDHNYKQCSSVHPVALSRALDEIRMTPLYENCRLKLALFHHPVGGADEARLIDSGFLERLAQAGFRFALHGHVHEAGDWSWPYYRTASGFHILAAGTFGAVAAERPHSVPFSYQVLEVGVADLAVHARRRNKDSGAWEPDARHRQAPGQPNSDTLILPL